MQNVEVRPMMSDRDAEEIKPTMITSQSFSGGMDAEIG